MARRQVSAVSQDRCVLLLQVTEGMQMKRSLDVGVAWPFNVYFNVLAMPKDSIGDEGG